MKQMNIMFFSILLFASLAQAAENIIWDAETSKRVLLGDTIYDLGDKTTFETRAAVSNHTISLKGTNGRPDQKTALTVAELFVAARKNEERSHFNGGTHGEFCGFIYGAAFVGSLWAVKEYLWNK